MVTAVRSKKSQRTNTDSYVVQCRQLGYSFSSSGVRGTPLLNQVNMQKCRVARRGEENVQHVGTPDHRVLLLLWEDCVVVLYVSDNVSNR